MRLPPAVGGLSLLLQILISFPMSASIELHTIPSAQKTLTRKLITRGDAAVNTQTKVATTATNPEFWTASRLSRRGSATVTATSAVETTSRIDATIIARENIETSVSHDTGIRTSTQPAKLARAVGENLVFDAFCYDNPSDPLFLLSDLDKMIIALEKLKNKAIDVFDDTYEEENEIYSVRETMRLVTGAVCIQAIVHLPTDILVLVCPGTEETQTDTIYFERATGYDIPLTEITDRLKSVRELMAQRPEGCRVRRNPEYLEEQMDMIHGAGFYRRGTKTELDNQWYLYIRGEAESLLENQYAWGKMTKGRDRWARTIGGLRVTELKAGNFSDFRKTFENSTEFNDKCGEYSNATYPVEFSQAVEQIHWLAQDIVAGRVGPGTDFWLRVRGGCRLHICGSVEVVDLGVALCDGSMVQDGTFFGRLSSDVEIIHQRFRVPVIMMKFYNELRNQLKLPRQSDGKLQISWPLTALRCLWEKSGRPKGLLPLDGSLKVEVQDILGRNTAFALEFGPSYCTFWTGSCSSNEKGTTGRGLPLQNIDKALELVKKGKYERAFGREGEEGDCLQHYCVPEAGAQISFCKGEDQSDEVVLKDFLIEDVSERMQALKRVFLDGNAWDCDDDGFWPGDAKLLYTGQVGLTWYVNFTTIQPDWYLRLRKGDADSCKGLYPQTI
ncbi:hypothetical protein TWF281_011295 [Arthrobotrys megalospora]